MYLWKDRRLHLRITRLGIQYVAVMTVVGVLGVYTNNNLLHAVFGLMIGLLLVSGWVSRASLQNIRPGYISEGAFFAQTKGGLRLRLSDSKPKRTRCLDIYLDISNCRAEPVFFPSAKGKGSPLAVFRVRPEKRGIAKIRSINFSTSHPFGFLEKTMLFPADMHILVAPRPVGSDSAIGGSGEFADPDPKSGYSGSVGARPFAPGDTTSLIHWKRTAQRGEPWVRLMEGDQPKGVFLELDLTAWAPGQEFEDELEKISGSILQAKLIKTNVTLTILGRHGRRDLHGHLAAWRALAEAEGEDNEPRP
jgi:uncharacterized protein (DUF58 family)